MKVLTAAQMGAVDRATIESGIPGLILMETAAAQVVEFIAERFAPVRLQRIVVVCGKGNNGGDGLAVARQLHVRFAPLSLHVVLLCGEAGLSGDAAANLKMLQASGVQPLPDFGAGMRNATLVIDAVLGTGTKGAARGSALDAIVEINSSFPLAKIVSVDLPSGLSGDTGAVEGEYVRADATVTFTAPRICHAMPPACRLMGELRVVPIGSPAHLLELEQHQVSLVTSGQIVPLFRPRPRDANKGNFGHVLIVAGSRGKSGAAAMAGLAALRAGAGLVTVACPESALESVARFSPEIMTEPLPETAGGVIALSAFNRIAELAATRTVTAIGPGIGTDYETRDVVPRLFAELAHPMVVDADGLNCLAGTHWHGGPYLRVLTPHPGEMSRLLGSSTAEIQKDRMSAVRELAALRRVVVVLKGERTLIGFPDGRVWINPTGSPAMATAGTGDILTGIVAGFLAQNAGDDLEQAIAGSVYAHGLAGELAARDLTEQCVIATDLLKYLPEGIREITHGYHKV